MAEDEVVSAVAVTGCGGFRRWLARMCGSWTILGSSSSSSVDDSQQQSPRLELSDDAEDLRSYPLAEKKFLIQFQATHSDNYADMLTPAQLQPMTERNVYGAIRFAYPVSRTSCHDPLSGTHTLLALAIPETYTNWVNIDHWPHITTHLLGNFWRITLVAEVDSRCESAEVGLLSLQQHLKRGRSLGARDSERRSGSE